MNLYRIVQWAAVPSKNPKNPPEFRASLRWSEIRPGAKVVAADGRGYLVDEHGSLRREVTNRGRRNRPLGKGEEKARAQHVAILEAELARRVSASARRRASREQRATR